MGLFCKKHKDHSYSLYRMAKNIGRSFDRYCHETGDFVDIRHPVVKLRAKKSKLTKKLERLSQRRKRPNPKYRIGFNEFLLTFKGGDQ